MLQKIFLHRSLEMDWLASISLAHTCPHPPWWWSLIDRVLCIFSPLACPPSVHLGTRKKKKSTSVPLACSIRQILSICCLTWDMDGAVSLIAFPLYSSLIELYLKCCQFNRGNNPGTLPRTVSYIEMPALQCGTCSEHFRAGTTLSYWTLIEMLAFEHRKQSWAGCQVCFLCSNVIISMWYLLWAFQSRYHFLLNFNWNAGIWIEETNNPGALSRIVFYVQTPVFQC